MGSTLKVAGLLALGVVAGALATMQVQAIARNDSGVAALPLQELQQLATVFGIVKSSYVEPVDEKQLITDAIGGMVSGLDPHSVYLDAKDYKEFREGTSGHFVGVGIEIGMEDGLVKVVTPIEDTPAFKAGLKSGDLITRIDDTAVRGLTLDQAVKRMRGERGTKVALTVFRKSESRSFKVDIVRDQITMQSVRVRMVAPGYGWVRVSQFQDPTVEDFVTKVNDLYRQDPKIKGLVLDLRNDPGGLLDGAIAVSDAFLPPDVVVVRTKGQIADANAVYKASADSYQRRGTAELVKRLPAQLKKVPLVVLVNEASASASEIVAGALQDHGRATIMGAQTFGKGSVQNVLPLSANTALKLTTSRYYTPNDRSIQAKGIVPDVWVDETAEGNVYAALFTREADLDHHLGDTDAVADAARDKAREAAREKLQEAYLKSKEPPKPLPTFGSAEDFPLQQALNHLQGKPVQVSKTATERKPGEDAEADEAEASDAKASDSQTGDR